MKWIIVKKRTDKEGYEISLHPFVKDDPIYEFESLEEAETVMSEIKNNYDDSIDLSIISTIY